MTSEGLALLLTATAAVVASIVAAVIGRIARIPLVVFEILLGVVLGPSLLGWIQPNDVTDALADFGLAMLFFMAGSEIDFPAIHGRPLVTATVGWLI